MKIITNYIIFINIFTFLIFGIDKYKAIKHEYRIKEKTLLGLCIIGGAFGGLFGMKIFRHKTLKPIFKYTIPIISIIEIILIIYIER